MEDEKEAGFVSQIIILCVIICSYILALVPLFLARTDSGGFRFSILLAIIAFIMRDLRSGGFWGGFLFMILYSVGVILMATGFSRCWSPWVVGIGSLLMLPMILRQLITVLVFRKRLI